MNSTTVRSIITITVFAIVLLILRDNVSSLTVDLASHYSLVRKIQDNLFINVGYILNLGEMADYPPISHYISAFFGYIFKSSLQGVSIACILAILVFYTRLFSFFSSQGIFLIIFFCVVAFFSKELPFVGNEIIGGNFLFPQLVGISLFLILAIYIYRSRDTISYKNSFIHLILFTAMLSVHPSIAAVSYGFIAIFLCTLLAGQYIHKRGFNYRPILLFLIMGALIFKFHPYTKFASAIKTHNGALGFPPLGIEAYEMHFNVYILILITFLHSGAIIFKSILDDAIASSKAQAAMLLFPFASIALMQIFLYELGYVSAYVVKKNMFGIFTFWLLVLAHVPSLPSRLRGASLQMNKYTIQNSFWSSIGAAVVAFSLFIPINHKVSELDKTIAALRTLHKDAIGKEWYRNTMTNLQVPMPINWLYTIGELEAYKWGPLSHAIITTDYSAVPDDAYVIIDRDIDIKDRSTLGGGLYRYQLSALKGYIKLDIDANAIEVGKTGSGINLYLKSGFAPYADWGHWSVGKESEIKFESLPAEGDKVYLRLKMTLTGYINEKHPSCDLRVILNNDNTRVISLNTNGFHTFEFPLDRSTNKHYIKILSLNPISPRSIGMSLDERPLCFGVKEISYK